ncbi:MAG TPA: type IV toxin-antitoxin system AbiEi family antitoxin domain-containing protein [Acidimicrobiia bacterium]|nr:type IV toxin-antitoxin system AbiEi family antitoxin domain-containing protein [Acidimicrobiia bacterium]
MRRLFTAEEAAARGLTREALRWGERRGRWRRIDRQVYAEGADDPDAFDRARARVLATGGIASGRLAGVLHGLDGVTELDERPLRRRVLPEHRIVAIDGIRCTDGLQALVDLAANLDDLRWEQALESALRRGLTSLPEIEAALSALSRARTPGVPRMRRVLTVRGGEPPTESLLETLMVQLVRRVNGLPDPARQFEVVDQDGSFVARVDLAWPELCLFLELDGQHHKGQPVYDARWETAVVAATGWLPGRFTWHEVVRIPASTTRRLVALAEQARGRRVPNG